MQALETHLLLPLPCHSTHKHQRAASEVSMRGKVQLHPQNIGQNTEDRVHGNARGKDPQL